MTRPLRVFLCHASQDKPAVRGLYNALKEEDWIDPWLDKAKILPGQDWELVIEKAVEDSDVVIVCLSNQSVTKEGFVQREIRYAYDIALEKPEEIIFLIPLRLDECIVPRKLRTLHWVDYFGVDKENSYSDLLEALKLRYGQKLPLEAGETKRRQAEEKAKREADELVRRLAAEQSARENAAKERAKRESAKQIARGEEEQEEAYRIAREKLNDEIAEEIIQENAQHEVERKLAREKTNPEAANFRRLGIGGIILLVLIFGGFGLNYLIKNLPVPSLTPVDTATPAPPTLTSVPFTATPQPTKTFTPIPTLGIIQTMISEKGETLVYVPAGEFTMGSSDGDSDEKPIHTVYLDAFWLDQTEVTNKQYKACVDAGTCEPPSLSSSYTHPNYYGNPEFDNYPVVYVNWDKANRYCEVWMGTGGSLPTEAQWEKAARGPQAFTYPWGNEFPNNDLVNFNGNRMDTTVVGKYPDGKSFYGAYDMAGNVWEWVNSLYKPYPYNASDGRENLNSKESRLLRGGSWYDYIDRIRTTGRNKNKPDIAYYSVGFRCARSQP